MKSLILALLMTGCAVNPPVPAWTSGQRNACLPEAAVMSEGLKKADIKAEVVILRTPMWSHAVAAYLYPTGENQLWVWDAEWKSIRVRAYFDDADQIARAWCNATGKSVWIDSAEILK
jgi:hypothetical protein